MTNTPRHPETEHLLGLFEYRHLPRHLAAVSAPVSDLAHRMADTLGDGPELSVGLRHLVYAKDALVRQAVEDRRKADGVQSVCMHRTMVQRFDTDNNRHAVCVQCGLTRPDPEL